MGRRVSRSQECWRPLTQRLSELIASVSFTFEVNAIPISGRFPRTNNILFGFIGGKLHTYAFLPTKEMLTLMCSMFYDDSPSLTRFFTSLWRRYTVTRMKALSILQLWCNRKASAELNKKMTFSLDVFDWLRVESFYITSNFIEERTVNPLELFKLLRFFPFFRNAGRRGKLTCVCPQKVRKFSAESTSVSSGRRVLKPTRVPFFYTILRSAARSLHFLPEARQNSRFHRSSTSHE